MQCERDPLGEFVKSGGRNKSAKSMRKNLFLASISRSSTCLNDVVRSLNSAIRDPFRESRDRKYIYSPSELDRETSRDLERSQDSVFVAGREPLTKNLSIYNERPSFSSSSSLLKVGARQKLVLD